MMLDLPKVDIVSRLRKIASDFNFLKGAIMAKTFAQKLDQLIRSHRKEDGTAYTYAEIVAQSNGRLTISNLSQLRHGRTQPGYDVIQALCDTFGVEPNYFFEHGEEALLPSKPIDVDEDVLQIAFRAQELDESGREALLKIIKTIQAAREKK